MADVSKLFRGVVLAGAALGVGACGGSDDTSQNKNPQGGGGGSTSESGGAGGLASGGSAGSSKGGSSNETGGSAGASAGSAGSTHTGGGGAQGGAENSPSKPTDCAHTQQFHCEDSQNSLKCRCDLDAPLSDEDCDGAEEGPDFMCDSYEPPTGCRCIALIR